VCTGYPMGQTMFTIINCDLRNDTISDVIEVYDVFEGEKEQFDIL